MVRKIRKKLKLLVMMYFNKEFNDVKDIFIDGDYKLIRMNARIIGIWPEERLLFRVLLPFVHTMLIISILIPQVRGFLRVLDDLDLIIVCLPSFIIIFAAGFKLYTIISKKNEIFEIITQIREDWKQFNNAFSGNIMYKYANLTFTVTLIYQALMYGVAVTLIIFPVIPAVLDVIMPLNGSRYRPPIFETDYGVDQNDYFVPIVLHAFICTMQLAHTFVTVDSLVFMMVEHCCGLFDIIDVILNQLNDETRNFTDNEECKIINNAIAIHNRAIKFAILIQATFSNMYAIILLCNMSVISMTGVMIIIEIGHKDWGSVIRFTVYCAGTMFHLFANSIPGQELYNHSEAVHNIVYSCNWSILSIKAKILIKFMLLRCTHPCDITAGGFYVMNMQNFGKVMQTSMSYLTVLTSMR